jgi:hypothetical protein
VTPGGPARRGGAIAALLLLVALAPPALLPTRADAGQSPAEATPRETPPFDVVVDALSPVAPEPEDDVVVTGRIVAAEPLRNVTVRLRTGRVVTSRSALALADEGLVPVVRSSTSTQVADRVAADSVRSFRISVPVAELRLTQLGVHPLQVEARAAVGGDNASEAVQTYLPFFPEPLDATTRLAVTLPLAAPIRRGPDGVYRDDSLAEELAPDGRLGRVLEAGAAARDAGVAVTWVVDPALAESAARMTEPYDVRAAYGTTEPGTGGEVASAWLARARDVLRGAAVVALPYADPDVTALVRAGQAAEVRFATSAGRDLVAEVLEVEPLAGWSLPPEGLVTPSAVDALTQEDTTRLVLADTAVERDDATAVTPDARVRLDVSDEPLDVLVADTALGELIADGSRGLVPVAGDGRPGDGEPAVTGPGAPRLGQRLAVQRVAAETALLTAERPGTSRRVVVTPPRQWTTGPDFAVRLLAGFADQPWLRPATLPQLLDGTGILAGTEEEVGEGALSAEGAELAADRELPESFLEPLAEARRDLESFSEVLTDRDRLVRPLRLALLRSASAAWRPTESRGRGRALRDETLAFTEQQRAAVRLDDAGPVTFTADTGTIPLTVVNDLDQAVVVQVAVDPEGQARLLSGAGVVQEIAAGRRATVEVRAEVRTSGQFPVVVRLRSPQGTQLGAPVEVTVRSTAYGRVAVLITLGAAAVLVLAAGVRLVRRSRRHASG